MLMTLSFLAVSFILRQEAKWWVENRSLTSTNAQSSITIVTSENKEDAYKLKLWGNKKEAKDETEGTWA